MSERFADHLVGNTTKYGMALLCYAKSRASHKIQQLTDLLISYCLVQSAAYPSASEMDPILQALVDSPRMAFSDIVENDPEAAAELQFYTVGYACIRKFYTLRDEGLAGSRASHRPLARRRAATKALGAAINSAADSIYGGLYDPQRQSAIQVDGLLTLLGEATALLSMHSDKRTFTSDQLYGILAAVEDLETVSFRVYDATEGCLEASLRNFNGSQPPSPHAMLKKSMSSGTNSNFSFSMMGSEMLANSKESIGQKSMGSAVFVGGAPSDVERGWDWRTRFKDGETTGKDVLAYLRQGIARELSLTELEE